MEKVVPGEVAQSWSQTKCSSTLCNFVSRREGGSTKWANGRPRKDVRKQAERSMGSEARPRHSQKQEQHGEVRGRGLHSGSRGPEVLTGPTRTPTGCRVGWDVTLNSGL